MQSFESASCSRLKFRGGLHCQRREVRHNCRPEAGDNPWFSIVLPRRLFGRGYLMPLERVRLEARMQHGRESSQIPKCDRLSNLPHDVKVKVDVVKGSEDGGEQLSSQG